MSKPTNNKKGTNKGMTVKVMTADEIAAKAAITPVKTVLSNEEKAAAKAAAAEKHYQEQLKALLDIGLTQDQAEKALIALKPVKAAARGANVKVNDFEEAIIKIVLQSCKKYEGDTFSIVPLDVDSISTSTPGMIRDKIAEKVGYFKPNACKTGKTCTTSDSDAVNILYEAYCFIIASRIAPACKDNN